MADIDRHTVVDNHGSNAAVWAVVAVLVVIVLALLFLWPGWLVGADDGADVINIEQQADPNAQDGQDGQDGQDSQGSQDTQDTDVNVIVPEGSEDTTP